MADKKQQVDSIKSNVEENEVVLDDMEYDIFGKPPQPETVEYPPVGERLTILAQAFEHAPDGIQISTISGQILYSNKAIEKIYGYTAEEQKGEQVGKENAIPGFAEKHIIPAIKKNGNWEGEISGKCKDGRIISVWLTTSVVKNDQGMPIALIGISRDISKLKHTETLLSLSENKYRTLLELAPDAVFVADADTGIIVEANQNAGKLLGLKVEEIIGLHHSKIHPPDKEDEYRERFKQHINVAPDALIEVLVRHFDGHDIPVEVSSRLVKVEGKSFMKGIFRDLTKRNRAKELGDNLNEVNSLINETLDINKVVDKVVSTSAAAIGADSAAFFLLEDDYWVLEQIEGPSPHEIGTRLPYDMLNPPTNMIENPAPVAISDAGSDDHSNSEMARKVGLKSLMLIPLVSDKQVLGMLVFRYFTKQMEFTEEEKDFGTKLGASISMALENARLFSEQQSISGALQESLLATPKEIPQIEFGQLYRSASEAALVGGDFFDLFTLQGNRIAVVIGDVSGKGLEAAALTSSIKHVIKSYAYEGHFPEAIISKTNFVFMKETDPSTFITVFIGILDTQSGVLTYCCAGHPPPIIKRQNGDIDLLDTSGLPVGVLEYIECRDKQQVIKEGDLITLYTDGVTEARCGNDMFGENRLIEFLRNTTELPTSEVPKIILDKLTRHEYALSDDMAILSLSLRSKL